MSDQDDVPDNVIPLRPLAEEYEGHVCACGSAWFTADGICINKEFRVTGYTMPIRCFECGAEASSPVRYI